MIKTVRIGCPNERGMLVLRYRLLEPIRVEPGRKYPLVMVLHSSGTPIGTDIRSIEGARITFWEIDGLRHEIYPPLYTTDVVPAWLFRQRKQD